MTKIKVINSKKFKKKKALVFMTTITIGIGALLGGYIIKNNNERKPYAAWFFDRPYTDYDKYVWWGEVPKHTLAVVFTILPSDSYRFRIYKGETMMSHYRIEVADEYSRALEYLDWQEIPEDGLITVNREDFSQANQYGTNVMIQYGVYDKNLGMVIEGEPLNEKSYIVFDEDTLEEVEHYNNIRNIMIEEFKKTIDENDTDFDKVKKAYDFIIEYTQYNHYVDVSLPTSFSNYINSKGIHYTDCTGYTDIMNSILNSVGIESFSVVDITNLHIWNIVRVDGDYYHVDATFSDTGSWSNTSKYRYFLVSDSEMHAENRWFIKEKDVDCNESYDLMGIVKKRDLKYRDFN